MRSRHARKVAVRVAAALWVGLAVVVLASCSGEVTDVDRAKARVSAEEKNVAQAEADLASAVESFCGTSRTYITALDRYGDILTDTAPTVGDVRDAGSDLTDLRDDAFDGAEAAAAAQQSLVSAEQELATATAALALAEAGTPAPSDGTGSEQPQPTPLAPTASVERVKQADEEFSAAQDATTDETTLADASEQFNSAAVALEMAWLRLFADAGCIPDEQQQAALAAVSGYTASLQQSLADAGHYAGSVDGIYGPETVSAVEDLQKANGLPVTGTVDKATAEALNSELLALGGAAAQEAVASTAAVQQTLKLAGFWDGPVDGTWTPALTEAVKAFQTALGVEPTGSIDASTIAAFNEAIAELAAPEPTPSAEPSETP
ncbi:peptidoglycan-binding domain-containing protein [Microbacterium sp. CFBP9034]|uniref:peptidoglycan-binding domain-containing protein n=1 Tax=Microbacterium sp. CFBP9034 TaxID=3096540 RepID=UPI002A6B5C11|nr:peptidoglycan-binding domain-containing protein [Microbacterium sp. CFBP9034]MDY0910147.1 peptidoglycan-binding domain-containing protein [Microbacterium sp. CFBP9034]